MRIRHAAFIVALLLGLADASQADVLIRWDRNEVPSPDSLGLSTLVVPAKSTALVKAALAAGYRVYLEVDANALTGLTAPAGSVAGLVVNGKVSAEHVRRLRLRFNLPAGRVVVVDAGAKWPHIRTNWVTKNNEVLQVAGRSAQPWIENNAALFRILRAASPSATPLVTYPWQPITRAETDRGPALANYLVAIAEAGSFGADLLLPLHQHFQDRLLLGEPQARAEWREIRRHIEFYSWNLAARYRPVVNIGIVAAHPMLHFETMNLLARHNLPFRLVTTDDLNTLAAGELDLLIVLDALDAGQVEAVDAFARKGGLVHRAPKPVADPDAFALEMRRLLGSGRRVIDIWNGITVLAAPYKTPDGSALLVTALNYAHESLPVQLRVRGTYSVVQYESPGEAPALLPYRHRDGYTEFVLPALGIGGRVFLSQP